MKTLILFLGFFLSSFIISSQTNASINKIYLQENMERVNVFPAAIGYHYELIFVLEENWKRPKATDLALVKIKNYHIDGSLEEEKEAKIDLAKLGNNINSAKLQKGIRKMHIGDKYRFFIPQKIDYDPELYVYISCPLIKIYEVELIDILKKDGTSKHPKQTARYRAVNQSDDFNTAAIYKIAKQKAYVKGERARIREEQMIRANQIYGHNNY